MTARLHWRQPFRGVHMATVRGGGRYTIQRWADVWVVWYLAGSAADGHRPETVEWPDHRRSLAAAKQACAEHHQNTLENNEHEEE